PDTGECVAGELDLERTAPQRLQMVVDVGELRLVEVVALPGDPHDGRVGPAGGVQQRLIAGRGRGVLGAGDRLPGRGDQHQTIPQNRLRCPRLWTPVCIYAASDGPPSRTPAQATTGFPPISPPANP